MVGVPMFWRAGLALNRHRHVLSNPESTIGSIVAHVPLVALVDADIGNRFLIHSGAMVGIIMHVVVRPCLTGGSVSTKPGSFAPRLGPIPVCASLRASGPTLEGGEHIAQQRPNKRKIGDENGDGCFAKIPVHVDVGDQRRNQAVDFVQDGRNNDKDSHAEEDEKDDFLLERNANLHQKWNGDSEHEDIGGDGDAALDDLVILVRRALVFTELA